MPESPAIDTGLAIDELSVDQRNLTRAIGSAPDLGAVEYQGRTDLAFYWQLDLNGDGTSFGIEFATGADPFTRRTDSPMLPSAFSDESGAGITFGVNPDAAPNTIWIVKRSYDLLPGSFIEVFRMDGRDGNQVVSPEFTIDEVGSMIRLIDESMSEPRSFYQFSAMRVP